jgi:hypothetical protein
VGDPAAGPVASVVIQRICSVTEAVSEGHTYDKLLIIMSSIKVNTVSL